MPRGEDISLPSSRVLKAWRKLKGKAVCTAILPLREEIKSL